jgi:hypothetical protein
MKCENNNCDNDAYTIFDMICKKCGIRWCKECSQKYKCNFCRLRYCPCYGVMCPYTRFHVSISWKLSHDIDDDDIDDDDAHLWDNIIHNDEKFINYFDFNIPYYRCTSEKVVLNGKLTLNLAKFVVDKLNTDRKIGNEIIHIEADSLWQWYIMSMKFYTIDEARNIANVILDINREDFWYA